jgi:aspartate-semialdehyde dehydrogenase
MNAMPNNETSMNPTNPVIESARHKYRVAIVGATGMVGQQLIRMLKSHPWLSVVKLAASASSAGKPYAQAVGTRWCMDFAIPDDLKAIKIIDAENVQEVVSDVDIVFSAISASKEEILRLEDAYAKAGAWVTSCNSAYRMDPLVPMMIPAANPQHLEIIEKQRKARGYTTGAIIVKSNCSIQSYVIALEPLRKYGIEKIRVHSEQAISGAGKTFDTWPEMLNNLIPLISGEEQKSEQEPLKIWGQILDDGIKNASAPRIKAKCVRVAVQDGHTAYVDVQFKKQPTAEEITECWQGFKACEGLPSAPSQFIHVKTEADRPQPRLDVMTENGMAVTVGQLKVDEDGVSFTALAHNAILGAAGGAVLATELAIQKKLVHQRSLALA